LYCRCIHFLIILDAQFMYPTAGSSELRRFCPTLRVVRFHGGKKERQRLMQEVLVLGNFDVCITTYEQVAARTGLMVSAGLRYDF
jgi:hypothetical protein